MTFKGSKWVAKVALLIGFIVILASCGSAPATESTTAPSEPTTAPANEETTTTTPTGSLVIYSGRSEALITPIIDAFKAKYPAITVELKSGKNNELAAAILEEKANPQADVFISTDMLTHINLSKEGVLRAAPIAGTEGIAPELKAADGTWTSITSRARVIMYNTTLVTPEEAPKSIFDLTDPKWKGKIAATNTTSGAMQAHVAALKKEIGDEKTQAWLDGLVANEVTFFGGHTDIRKAVGAGEFAIGLVNHYYYELQKREATDNQVGVVYPDQGEGQLGVMMNTTAIGQIEGSKNPDNAKLFAEFLFTTETQTLFAQLNYEYPVLAGIKVADGVTDPSTFRIKTIDMQVISNDVPAAIEMMQSAGIP
ncbi:MAG: extracellular solute-binding protein [Chloroflexota bacterium]|jgi:iron(III) transport system substrate-binding protein